MINTKYNVYIQETRGGGVLFMEIQRSRGILDLGVKNLRENYLSFHRFCYSSLKDNKKLEMQVWGFKSEIRASSILNGLPVKGRK